MTTLSALCTPDRARCGENRIRDDSADGAVCDTRKRKKNGYGMEGNAWSRHNAMRDSKRRARQLSRCSARVATEERTPLAAARPATSQTEAQCCRASPLAFCSAPRLDHCALCQGMVLTPAPLGPFCTPPFCTDSANSDRSERAVQRADRSAPPAAASTPKRGGTGGDGRILGDSSLALALTTCYPRRGNARSAFLFGR